MFDVQLGDFRVPLTPELAAASQQAVATLRDLLNDLPERSAAVAKGGSNRQDALALEQAPQKQRFARRRLLFSKFHAIAYIWRNVDDHLHALEQDIGRDPMPVWSPLTLARAAFEGTILSCYLLDSTASPAQRLARSAALRLTESENEIKLARTFNPEILATCEKKADKVLRWVERAGMRLERGRQGKLIKVWVDEEWAAADINMTEASTRFLPPDVPSPYRLTSGAAHSRPWLISTSEPASDTPTYGRAESATVMAAVNTARMGIAALAEQWCRYVGAPEKDVLDDIMKGYRRHVARATRLRTAQRHDDEQRTMRNSVSRHLQAGIGRASE